MSAFDTRPDAESAEALATVFEIAKEHTVCLEVEEAKAWRAWICSVQEAYTKTKSQNAPALTRADLERIVRSALELSTQSFEETTFKRLLSAVLGDS